MERLVAGVVVIGLLLWGASILATPDEALEGAPDARPQEARDGGTPFRTLPAPDDVARDEDEPEEEGDDKDDEDDRDDDEDDREGEPDEPRRGKNKGKRGGG